ncbi:hypothetical protein AB0L05_17210 [Nonomuraea pusilla]|uniref:HNH endonuclease n=1 Tax=Nonomuraea pusilla TaxID=46177 RepID=UPI00332ED590
MREYLAARDGARCFYCLTPFDSLDEVTFDHFVPRSRLRVAGSRGVVLACWPCNFAKADQLPRGLVVVLLSMRAAPRMGEPGVLSGMGEQEPRPPGV